MYIQSKSLCLLSLFAFSSAGFAVKISPRGGLIKKDKKDNKNNIITNNACRRVLTDPFRGTDTLQNKTNKSIISNPKP